MALSNPEKHALELGIFQLRSEAGMQKFREWLLNRQSYLNSQWPSAVGDELLQMQGEAKLLQKQLKLLENGPTFKEAAK